MPTIADRQAIEDKHAEIREAANAQYSTPAERKTVLQKLQEEKRKLVEAYRGKQKKKPASEPTTKPDMTKKILGLLQKKMPSAPNPGVEGLE